MQLGFVLSTQVCVWRKIGQLIPYPHTVAKVKLGTLRKTHGESQKINEETSHFFLVITLIAWAKGSVYYRFSKKCFLCNVSMFSLFYNISKAFSPRVILCRRYAMFTVSYFGSSVRSRNSARKTMETNSMRVANNARTLWNLTLSDPLQTTVVCMRRLRYLASHPDQGWLHTVYFKFYIIRRSIALFVYITLHILDTPVCPVLHFFTAHFSHCG